MKNDNTVKKNGINTGLINGSNKESITLDHLDEAVEEIGRFSKTIWAVSLFLYPLCSGLEALLGLDTNLSPVVFGFSAVGLGF